MAPGYREEVEGLRLTNIGIIVAVLGLASTLALAWTIGLDVCPTRIMHCPATASLELNDLAYLAMTVMSAGIVLLTVGWVRGNSHVQRG